LRFASQNISFSGPPYPVIRININALNPAPEIFDTELISELQLSAENHQVEIFTSSPMAALSSLIRRLSFKHVNSSSANDKTIDGPCKNVVLLIDEYDFPLLDKIHDFAQCELIRLKLDNFYSAVKASYQYLKFTFITGITKFQQVSLFSSLNTVIDLTLNSDFAEICGFTEKEILKYYKPNLKKAIPKLISSGHLPPKASVKMLMKVILDWYDGYKWDSTKKVLNPF
jgi:hypothetical protein